MEEENFHLRDYNYGTKFCIISFFFNNRSSGNGGCMNRKRWILLGIVIAILVVAVIVVVVVVVVAGAGAGKSSFNSIVRTLYNSINRFNIILVTYKHAIPCKKKYMMTELLFFN